MSIRVLIVDAVPAFQLAIERELVARGGYEIVGIADNPTTGIELARTVRPDVVVVDLDLPHLAGSNLIARLRDEVDRARIVLSTWRARPAIATATTDVPRADLERIVALVSDLDSATAPTVSIDLPGRPASVGRSRRFVESWCLAWGHTAALEPAMLVVSELVTNAITHGGGTCELRLKLGTDALRVEVLDSGHDSPEVARASMTAEGGRGLQIVALTSRAWGVEDADSGWKVIWAEIPVG